MVRRRGIGSPSPQAVSSPIAEMAAEKVVSKYLPPDLGALGLLNNSLIGYLPNLVVQGSLHQNLPNTVSSDGDSSEAYNHYYEHIVCQIALYGEDLRFSWNTPVADLPACTGILPAPWPRIQTFNQESNSLWHNTF